MEEHYKRTNYLDDLRALIFESRHELVKCQAELNVLSTRIPDIQKKCDKLAEDICEAKNSGESPSSERVEKLTKKYDYSVHILWCLRFRASPGSDSPEHQLRS